MSSIWDEIGRGVSSLGGFASNLAGQQIRLGPNGTSLGADIAGRSQPYYDLIPSVYAAQPASGVGGSGGGGGSSWGGPTPNTGGPPASGGGGSLGGGGGGNGMASPISGAANTAATFTGTTQNKPSDPYAGYDWNSLIQGPLNTLGQAETAQQSFYNQNVGQAETNRQSSEGAVNQYLTSSENTANQQVQGQQQQARTAQDQARQAYNEIQTGLQSLYGGTTGTGQFAEEIAGRQTQQNIGQLQTGLANNVQQIQSKLGEVKQWGAQQIQTLENQANDAKSQAKYSLEQAIAQIRSQEGALQSQKAQMVFNALSNYQGLLQQVDTNNVAYQRQVALQMQNAQDTLTAYASRYPGSQYTMPGVAFGGQNTPVAAGTQQGGTNPLGGGTILPSNVGFQSPNYQGDVNQYTNQNPPGR